MRKMCIVKKAQIEDWLLSKRAECSPGIAERMELACHLAQQGELKSYPVFGMVTRLLPNGDVRVKSPEETMRWTAADPTDIIEAADPDSLPTSVEFGHKSSGSDAGFWCFVGFLLGVIATEVVLVLGELEVVTSWLH